MLILTRKPEESLAIGDDIKVTVLGIEGNQARISINSSNDAVISREKNIRTETIKNVTKKDRPKITLKKKKITPSIIEV